MADNNADSLLPTSGKLKFLRHFEGILVSNLFEESRLRSAFRYEPRDDDVFVVGFPKTGTTWLHFVLETPIQSAAACGMNVAFLEGAGGEKVEKLPRKSGIPLVIKTHLPFEKVHFSDKSRHEDKSIKGDSSGGASKQRGANLVRNATVGDWKNHFSASQIERMKVKIACRTSGFRRDLEAMWKDASLP
ncbi:hypothetical protein HPB52_008423 [Rhipicephalus sanguineus]|uniref:Sulfotransferase domain-containing protein n=1 Tax=Rhipicephalus sanguineus TaxID=34632 RepID=A0A9D4T379_RHISA|nr:hypothetical protein HPB52_008423 [Rhipicephalus sanguineus]